MKFSFRFLFFAFMSGVFLGTGVSSRLSHQTQWGFGTGAKNYLRLLDRFGSEFDLLPAQKADVQRIIDTKRKKINAFRSEFRNNFDRIRTETNAEIRLVLDDKQRKKFDAMESKWEVQLQKNREESDRH